jgi:DNA-binding NarL/FixJ family response regulator
MDDEVRTSGGAEARPGGISSRIVVADDHPLFRSALLRVLDSEADLEVVGEAGNGEEAVEVCRRSRPELVLMDVMMPRMDGLEATRAIKRELPRTVVLVVTAFEDPDYLARALRAGASGYVLKSASTARIIDAVRRVLAGESPLDGEVAVRYSGCSWRRRRRERGARVGSALAAGDRGAAAHGEGVHQPADLTRPLYQRQHRQEARAERDLEARGF